MMTDAEFAAEIASLSDIIAELDGIARALSSQLAPVKRREEDIRRRITATYRHQHRDDGEDEVLGFLGDIETVRSTRIVGMRQVGEANEFDYGEIEVEVLVPDRSATMARVLLYDERDRLAEQYGHQRNRERDCYADLDQALRTRDRLRKAMDAAQEKRTQKPKPKGGSNDRQSALL